jgi:predicted  nucleic acid-binding Zn-ribbon protein
VIRTIALAQKRLAALKDEIEALRQGELSQLKSQVEEATAAGRDLLAEMAARVTERIDEAKTRFESLLSS